jgi:hypothetical protein
MTHTIVKYDSVNGLAYERRELIYSKNVYDISSRLLEHRKKLIPGYDKLECLSPRVTYAGKAGASPSASLNGAAL